MESMALENDYKTEKKERKYKTYIDPEDELRTIEIPASEYSKMNFINRNSHYGIEPVKFKLV